MVRFKNRYALFEVRAAPGEEVEVRAALRAAQVAKALREVIQTNFGDHGMACVQPSLNGMGRAGSTRPVTLSSPWSRCLVGRPPAVKYLSPTTGLCILRVARDHYRIVWLALTLLTELAGHACLVRVLHIGGKPKAAACRVLNTCLTVPLWRSILGWRQAPSVHANGRRSCTACSTLKSCSARPPQRVRVAQPVRQLSERRC